MCGFHAKAIQLICVVLYSIVICLGESPPLRKVQNIFEALGYSPSCVAVALASCMIDTQSIPPVNNYSEQSTVSQDKKLNGQLSSYPQTCADLRAHGDVISGVRTIYPFTCCPNRPVQVFCDQTTDEGGWTVLQKRDALPQREDFYRTWIEYVLGFGNLTGEYWLGLENIHALVSTTLMELRVDLEDFEGDKRWAKYEMFYVGDSESKYILNIGRYSGDAEDGLNPHNGFMFSTHDADHDTDESGSCAKKYRGAWWYSKCHTSNLNGFQYEGLTTTYADGIDWPFKGHYYSLKHSWISVRPKFRSF